MAIAKSCKKEYSKKEFTRKLKVDEYVFEIDGKDILSVELKYSFDFIESTIYKDGKKVDIVKEPAITIELCGKDRDNNDAWICFDLKTDLNYLNTLSSIPTDISFLLHCSESFIKRPLEELSRFLDFDLPNHTEDDIYKNLSSLWILKIRENEYIMKLCVPNEVFTYFKLVLENN